MLARFKFHTFMFFLDSRARDMCVPTDIRGMLGCELLLYEKNQE